MDDWKQKFEEIYRVPGDAPWTFKEPHPALVELVESGKIAPGGRVLEVSCGEGYHAIYLASKGFKVTAFDRSKRAIQYAIENAREANVKVNFLAKDYKDLNAFSGEFDFIFDWRFLHELTDENERREYVGSIARLLAKGGKYLSVAFSGDVDYWGKGKFRTAPTGIVLYFATLDDLIKLFSPEFKILEKKLIKVPQKPNLEVPAYYVLIEKK